MPLPDLDSTVPSPNTLGFTTRFLTLLGSFSVLLAFSWPILFSFDLWVFKDRSSFLNLDYLIEKHYRLGIDAFYAYGLLPVYLQHLVFQLFGRGYWPMVGCTAVVLVLSALFWALLLGEMPGPKRLLWGIAALSPLLLSVNPNFPYSLVVLSIQFALYFVLKERFDLALVCAVVGCFSVPSLPLALTVMLILFVLVEWWISKEERTLPKLARKLFPGFALYVSLFTGLSLFFGFRSMAMTALPVLGSKFYKANGMGKFSAFLSFLHPPGYGLKYYCAYYVSSSVTWFALSTLTILFIGAVVSIRMVRGRKLDHRAACVAICCVLQVVFISFAYGNRGQHVIYEPVLAAGTIVAISLPQGRFRKAILGAFITIGVIGETGQLYKTWVAWRTTAVGPDTAGLYADPGFASELTDILKIAGNHRLLMLSYATGVHHYFPNIENADVWFLYPGQLFPSDAERMFEKIDHADVIVEDLTSPSAIIDYDPEVKAHMAHMHELSPMHDFRVWERDKASPTSPH